MRSIKLPRPNAFVPFAKTRRVRFRTEFLKVMKNVYSKIEAAANVAIVCTALLFAAVLIGRYLFSTAPSLPNAESETIKTGTRLPTTDIDWSQNDKNLILALSTTCHFCTESAEFYERLVRQNAERGASRARLIAVFPQPVEETQRYLNERRIAVDEIKQSGLSRINVNGTPTLILVDNTGAVAASWIGKLPPEKESEVLARLSGAPADP